MWAPKSDLMLLPAPSRESWMDQWDESFNYFCLNPQNIDMTIQHELCMFPRCIDPRQAPDTAIPKTRTLNHAPTHTRSWHLSRADTCLGEVDDQH